MDLPQELEFRDVKKQSPVIVGKESRQILPQNGTSFTQGSSGQTQIVFRIPNDENTSWDLSTMWITAELQIGGLQAASYTQNACNAFDGVNGTPANVAHTLSVADSIESAIQRVHILINGSELERHDYYNVQETMLNTHTNNANFSNSIGSGCMLMNLSHIDKHKLLLGGAGGARTSSNILQVSFPLRWTGVANLRSLVPTYMLGGGQSAIEIRLFLASALDFITAGQFTTTNETPLTLTALSAADSNALNYTLSSVRMNLDCVQTSDQYSSSLREYLASNTLSLPIDTYYSTIYNFQATDNGWVNFTISTQFSDISAVYVAFFRSAEQNNTLFSGIDRMFRPPNINEARLLINGKPYPSVPIKFGSSGLEAEAYQYLMKALKQNCSLEVIGNTNASMVRTGTYSGYGTTGAAGVAAGTAKNVDTFSGSGLYYGQNKVAPLTTGQTTTDNILTKEEYFAKSPSSFMLGWSVAKSDYTNEYEMSGADLSKSSGLIQVNINFSQAIGAAYQAVVLIKHKRVLEIGLDNSQVIY
jgi:hypothetical protein